VLPAAAAAAVALLVGGLLPGGVADARRRPPPPSDPCLGQPTREARHLQAEVARLQGEVARLQAELSAYQGAYQELTGGLDRLERLATRRVADQRVQSTLIGAIGRSRDAAARYFAPAAPIAPVAPVPPPPPAVDPYAVGQPYPPAQPYAAPQPMSPAEFRALLESFAAARFADDRVALVRTVAQHSLFTVEQVVHLMKAADFDDTRVKIAVLLYPRVVDLEAWYRVYEAVDFDGSRAELRRATERPTH
jgi:hypothetical protein